MTQRNQLPGKFVWFEHVSKDAKKAQSFYGEVLGWKVAKFPADPNYEMIQAPDAPDAFVGGYPKPENGKTQPHWISYVSVEDVDAAAKAATKHGGKVLVAPFDAPPVGRMAKIADPQGAELYLFKNAQGDSPDSAQPLTGHLSWNELHTPEPKKALAFYEKVVGFSVRSMDMGPAGTYHILSKGGVDRAGVTSQLAPGVAPHWLPYITVDDADKTLARAKKLGATVLMPAEDVPTVGRIGVLADPTGAAIAIWKPAKI